MHVTSWTESSSR